MAYLIPTEDPDFVMPERYRSEARQKRDKSDYKGGPRYNDPYIWPKFKQGDLVVFNGGLYRVKEVIRRTAKHGKGKGAYLYTIGAHHPVSEKFLALATDHTLLRMGLQKGGEQ